MTTNELIDKIQRCRTAAANLLLMPHSKSATFEIREIPMVTLTEYANKYGQNLDAVNSAGYVECRTSEQLTGGTVYINLLSKRQVIMLTEE